MTEDQKAGYAAEFGDDALAALADEHYPEPQVRITAEGLWVLYALLDS